MVEDQEFLTVQLSSIKTQPVSTKVLSAQNRVQRGKRNDKTKKVIGQENKRDMIYINI